ncbi:probable G-protein coupled receptor Mth-like 5 [Ischnura elegans]|uniref:probable G-protein coupled receptor Mth-like 5 n=1 Tax=Ischnura elegans TaxID=197161 RepID=UPI001ED8864F|nr:probable G-protein coupled receptor Mth-like 5 [Ischnura elegans]
MAKSPGAYALLAAAFVTVALLPAPTSTDEGGGGEKSRLPEAIVQHEKDAAAPIPPVVVHKCCGADELLVAQPKAPARCMEADNDTAPWVPVFTSEKGETDVPSAKGARVEMAYGMIKCGAHPPWPVYQYAGSQDELALLPDGRLRHFTLPPHVQENHQHDIWADYDEGRAPKRSYDFEPGTYCMDKVRQTTGNEVLFAALCAPDGDHEGGWGAVGRWGSADFVLRMVVDPMLHALAIACLLIVAVAHFVVPQLRDLAGNIVSSMCVSLAVAYAADTVKIFQGFAEHVNFLAADILLYGALMTAFIWLNVMGYYVWKTFRSRNVYIRITDGRKYCYYSLYVILFTAVFTSLAAFSHFFLDMSPGSTKPKTSSELGWLGKAIFSTAIAFTILVNIYFFITTRQTINKMSSYGRIHQKMKFSFKMFIKLFLVMAITWMFLLLSWFRYDALQYVYIAINGIQCPLILYICICQRRVLFLVKKYCCFTGCLCSCCRPDDIQESSEWGEEMASMNT